MSEREIKKDKQEIKEKKLKNVQEIENAGNEMRKRTVVYTPA